MSDHPHIRCEKCHNHYVANQVLQLACLVMVPFVSAERSIALAILVLAFNTWPPTTDRESP